MLDYGIIGNCKTCSLIKSNASIDWFCFPSFDSPSIFAKLLDNKIGGSFEIITSDRYKTTQYYDDYTAVLVTKFQSQNSSFKVIDFFPRYRKILPNKKTKLFRQNTLIRIIEPIKGKPNINIVYNPKPNYAKDKTNLIIENDLLKTKEINLSSNLDYEKIINQEKIELNKTLFFAIGVTEKDNFNLTYVKKLLSTTKNYWTRWVGTLNIPTNNSDQIIRSAITLKLLTYSETGAIVAAPTTSIPEEIGSERTWDYRFCWVRDAVFTANAFKKIGRDYEAKKLLEFMLEQSVKKNKSLQLMYGINGETKLTEKKLTHLKGFKNSKPVRIGNAAYNQKQNDIYGSLIDMMYMYYVFYEYETKLPKRYWNFLKYLVKEIENNWKTSDHGIWEFRMQKQHFTYSKLMCYIGMDFAMKIAQHYEKVTYAEKWASLRDKIKDNILMNAWNEKKRSFTMYYGSEELDASVLKMSYHNFLEHDDPRMINTILNINKQLRVNSLVHRYKIEDDFGKSKSTFTICSFWLIDALYRIGEEKEAKKMYEKLKDYSNHLGLYAEDLTIKKKQNIGNFPQAYTHLALIYSSLLLSEWGTQRKKHENFIKKYVK